MTYNVQTIENLAECEGLLTRVNGIIADVSTDKINTESRANGRALAAEMTPAQLTALDAEIAAAQTQLAITVDPNVQSDLQLELASLAVKRLRALRRQSDGEGSSLILMQLEVGRLVQDLVALNEFKAALEARKVELQAA